MVNNLIFIVLDSVRQDFYDKFAHRIQKQADVSFAHAHAPSGWSTPSHASMFTGKLPYQHGIHTYSQSFKSLSTDQVFTTDLPHTTLGVTANVYAGTPYGFNRFFDTLIDIDPIRRFPDGLDPREIQHDGFSAGKYLRAVGHSFRHEHPIDSLRNEGIFFLEMLGSLLPIPKPLDDSGNAVVRNARQLIDQTEEPWFMFINMMDAHIPLQPFYGLKHSLHNANYNWNSGQYDVWELFQKNRQEITEYWNTRESLYGAYIDYIDQIVADFANDVMEFASKTETTVVITADHGENHAEPAANGLANHKSSLAEPLLHVPLTVLNAPAGASAPDKLVSLTDLPTLLTALAHGDWEDIGNRTITAEVMGLSDGPDPPDDMRGQFNRAIRTAIRGNTKITWDSLGDVREYKVDRSQPNWQMEIDPPATLPDWATEQFDVPLEGALAKAQSMATTHEVSDAVNSRLQDLGYVD
jgi:arylsulfatase A-like enzyme